MHSITTTTTPSSSSSEKTLVQHPFVFDDKSCFSLPQGILVFKNLHTGIFKVSWKSGRVANLTAKSPESVKQEQNKISQTMRPHTPILTDALQVRFEGTVTSAITLMEHLQSKGIPCHFAFAYYANSVSLPVKKSKAALLAELAAIGVTIDGDYASIEKVYKSMIGSSNRTGVTGFFHWEQKYICTKLMAVVVEISAAQFAAFNEVLMDLKTFPTVNLPDASYLEKTYDQTHLLKEEILKFSNDIDTDEVISLTAYGF